MVGHGAKFGRKKEEAIAALLSQRSIEDAARVANIGTNTLLRWLQLPEFKAAYREARREGVPGGDNSFTDPTATGGAGFGFRNETPDITSSNAVLGSGGPRAIQLGLKLIF